MYCLPPHTRATVEMLSHHCAQPIIRKHVHVWRLIAVNFDEGTHVLLHSHLTSVTLFTLPCFPLKTFAPVSDKHSPTKRVAKWRRSRRPARSSIRAASCNSRTFETPCLPVSPGLIDVDHSFRRLRVVNPDSRRILSPLSASLERPACHNDTSHQ
jgi:hypothetical protein